MVNLDSFDRSLTRSIAKEIEIFNRKMNEDIPYLLIGPGRWGTADPWLGIPVTWRQISNAKVIVELGIDDLSPDPSFGSHFFQNLTSLRIGYFTIQISEQKENIDLEWLNSQPVIQSTKYIRWIKLDNPLDIRIEGRSGKGIIIKPQQDIAEVMDEEESTGI